MTDAVRTAVVGGLTVRCRSSLPICIRAFENITVRTHPTPDPTVDYRLLRTPTGEYEVRCDERAVAHTDHQENLVELLRINAPGHVEHRHPNMLWLHAAAMAEPEPSNRVLVVVGPQGVGKSTAALSFCRAGWRYLADDLVLLDPGRRGVLGLSWAIRLPCRADQLELPQGYQAADDRWVSDDGSASAACCVRPPASAVVDSSEQLPLGWIVFLERGSAGPVTRPLTAGEMLLSLWPQRVARWDGGVPWQPVAAADALSTVPAAVVSSSDPEDVVPQILRWIDTP